VPSKGGAPSREKVRNKGWKRINTEREDDDTIGRYLRTGSYEAKGKVSAECNGDAYTSSIQTIKKKREKVLKGGRRQ